jgi:hypothetical protein
MATVDLQKQRTGKNLRLLHEVAAAVGKVNVAPEASQESPEVGSHFGGRNRPHLERVRDGCPIRVGQHGVGSGRAREAVFVEAHDEGVGPAGVAARPDRGDVQTAGTGGGAHHDERVGQPGEPFERLPRISAGMLRKPPLHVCQFGDEPVLRVVVELAPAPPQPARETVGPVARARLRFLPGAARTPRAARAPWRAPAATPAGDRGPAPPSPRRTPAPHPDHGCHPRTRRAEQPPPPRSPHAPCRPHGRGRTRSSVAGVRGAVPPA